MPDRPLVIIPGRFSASASALRHSALVTARTLSAAVLAAGGEPLTLHPAAPGGEVSDDEVRHRLRIADAVLLPGGGDLAPRHYGGADHPSLYDVDEEQDAFDLAVARVCLADNIPLLAICRGLQVVTVARGGTLLPDMGEGSHRHRVQDVRIEPTSRLAQVLGATTASISCFHHQCVQRPGDGLVAVAETADGTPEAFELPDHPGWFLGVQWHPEDSAPTDPVQAAVFTAFVAAARQRRQGVR